MSLLLDGVLDQASNGSPATVALSSESVAVLFFASAFLTERDNWLDKAEDPLDEVTDADWDEIEKLVGNVAYELMTPLTNLYPESFYVDALVLLLDVGGALSRSVNTAALLCHYIQITPIAQLNAWHFSTLMRSGTWELSVLGSTANNRGISTVTVSPGGTGGNIDWYSAASVANVVKTLSIVVPEDGMTEIGFSATIKNASSSNYDMAFEAIWARRTGEVP